MVKITDGPRRWAEFRFSVIGPLLASPPDCGIKKEFQTLAARVWKHPITGEPHQVSAATIERWYYRARRTDKPVQDLQRKSRRDIGHSPSLSIEMRQVAKLQYEQHRSWSYRLHADNLRVQFPDDCPSYDSIRRYMKSTGLLRQPRRRGALRPGQMASDHRRDSREVRSYEVPYVGSLWHLDFHTASRQIVTPDGRWLSPVICAVLDDHTRLCCHGQWYLTETTEDLVHCFTQALLKRGIPRALMSDNGSAMTSSEFTSGLLHLGITHETTLEYSPWQNGKQEFFWSKVEGRLLSMLESVKDLDLKSLNDATIAWIEREYNHEKNRETGQTPYERQRQASSVLRPAPKTAQIRAAFMMEVDRKLRRSDGTVSIEGRRFEVPSRYASIDTITVIYARWDLSQVMMIDKRNRQILCQLFPQDKVKNSDAIRRSRSSAATAEPAKPDGQIAPLLQKYLSDYAATGLPPAYISKTENKDAT